MENLEEKYRLLIWNYLSNQCTFKEKTDLLQWLEQSDENKKLFTEYHKIYELSASINHINKFGRERSGAWEQLNRNLESSLNEKEQQPTRKIGFYLKIAASIILIFSLGVVTSILIPKDTSTYQASNIEHEIIVPKGGKSEIILPDGSKVWLNAGTRFRYKGDYDSDNRNVYLEGEAYFSVVKNPVKPFIVNTSGIKIKAFGTSFNVKAYPEEKYVTTTLEEGVVRIEGKGLDLSLKPKEVVVLSKMYVKSSFSDSSDVIKSQEDKKDFETSSLDEKDVVLKNNIKVETDVNTDIYTSWKDNLWIIESMSLKDIAVILERRFNVVIKIESNELNEYTFTGTFYNETLEQILNVIKLTSPLNYKIDKGVVVIKEEQIRKSLYQL
jgi:ferric-dicitrate binding protein FerR (iron transport regulator)